MSAEASTTAETGSPPVKDVRLRWTGEGLVFRGGAPEGPEILVDGDGTAGPSPMDALLLSLAGCMGADLRLILGRSRVPVREIEVELRGVRAPDDPRRYEEVRMSFRVEGPEEEHETRLTRAVDLSRDRYCSVLHSLRSDLAVEIEIERG